MLKRTLCLLWFFAAFAQAELVGEWHFEGDTLDSSGNNILSEDLGNIPLTYIERDGQEAAYFDDESYVAIDFAYDTPQEAMSVSLWFNTTYDEVYTSWAEEIANWSLIDFDRTDYYNLSLTSDGRLDLGITFITSGSTIDYITEEAYNDGDWHQTVITYGEDGGLQIFVDGDLIISDIYQGAFGKTGSVRYGIIGDGSEAETYDGSRNYHYYEGAIDNIALYDNELSLTEVESLFATDSLAAVPSPFIGASTLFLTLLFRFWGRKENTQPQGGGMTR
ncbi:LamG-like jellyroll fold domain-containing protein [Alteromonas sp. 14N.309.X.WAT.G.H12]|uniref:LamG-like jellyroll fold domain-containing protein n=1 Tax=Alteromonas sp. 14N.309.X.WAT.G.H12 TaxID=3120824 RepID=UPI002FD2C584